MAYSHFAVSIYCPKSDRRGEPAAVGMNGVASEQHRLVSSSKQMLPAEWPEYAMSPECARREVYRLAVAEQIGCLRWGDPKRARKGLRRKI